ncbi:MAG: type IV toxin-antitoxin system AbiEi family antitoxin domain-containing protein [Agathobacter sp.]|uniref:type IV toxin-antitoxin system AbiEi family antitoxin domain-containing protein n=1 Tax=Agathobacter sp. TaxID=2021311 RepID=UPI0004E0B59F|nr:type IV toxin-antitoxin system AbiEi family antitoxin domain-containing protein [Agathobacter sp.]MBQ1681135.1 type IV toxin-antitoxin system AbiEi family antitoxin domain-containing protein [Agathobacter sp.]MCR5677636.1 type IV toxin-antitoxin system AbiEi family antitoxin domain-containing protein [Agathobacter sp.]
MATFYKRDEKADEILQTLKEQINLHDGILKREHLKALGIDYRRVLDFVETNDLVRIRNGYYTDTLDRFQEESLIHALFPDAVLCMESALFVHGYIKERPFAWNLAVDKNTSKSRFVLDYPKVIPYYTEEQSLLIGQTEIQYEGIDFKIYDKERVICDCLKYEAKMDRAIYREALLSYINDENKNIANLMAYARERKVVKKVQNIIGVWL